MVSVSARFIDAKKFLKLPATKSQKEYVVASLCVESLPGYYDFTEVSLTFYLSTILFYVHIIKIERLNFFFK